MDAIEYATIRYDMVEVENELNQGQQRGQRRDQPGGVWWHAPTEHF